jgi:hypothetical protein
MLLDETKGSRDTWTLIYSNMDSALLQAELQRRPNEGYSISIKLVREYIGQMKAAIGQPFLDENEEITFFRNIWPKFYSKLFYYQLINNFESDSEGKSAETQTRLTQEAEQVIADYFEEHKEFWSYYRDNSELINSQFTRKYSNSCHLDPLSELLDKEWGTIAGNRAAWALAYTDFNDYLHRHQESLANARRHWEWNESLTAAGELIVALARKRSIYINGKPATIAQLKADWENRYGIDLSNLHKLLHAGEIRKKDEAPYLTGLRVSFIESRD